MPFAVPNIPAFSFSNWGNAGVFSNLTPTQAGGTSRIGGNLYAYPPAGVEWTLTAWGFMAGTAPPGTTMLTVLARGFATTQRALAGTFLGYARAYGEIATTIEEFEPLMPVDVDLPDDDEELPEIADPTAILGTVVFKSAFTSAPTIIINQETTAFGYQFHIGDGTSHLTALGMPITPGNAYRWWIVCRQHCIAQAVSGPARAQCNIAFDFGPVFFAFT